MRARQADHSGSLLFLTLLVEYLRRRGRRRTHALKIVVHRRCAPGHRLCHIGEHTGLLLGLLPQAQVVQHVGFRRVDDRHLQRLFHAPLKILERGQVAVRCGCRCRCRRTRCGLRRQLLGRLFRGWRVLIPKPALARVAVVEGFAVRCAGRRCQCEHQTQRRRGSARGSGQPRDGAIEARSHRVACGVRAASTADLAGCWGGNVPSAQ